MSSDPIIHLETHLKEIIRQWLNIYKQSYACEQNIQPHVNKCSVIGNLG